MRERVHVAKLQGRALHLSTASRLALATYYLLLNTYYLLLTFDALSNAEILGWRLSRRGNAKTAEATLEDALVNRFGCLARTAQPLTLRSDNGLVFTSRRLTVTVCSYGIKQEFITPHTPQQNGMIERLFRTMKEQCIWLHDFKNFEEAQTTIGQWVTWYNTQRPHQALKMKTPKQAFELAA